MDINTVYQNLVNTIDNLPINTERKATNLAESATVSRNVFVTMLYKDLLSKHPDSTLTKQDINYILNSLSSCLSAVVAENKSVNLGFANIGGQSKKPQPLSGSITGKLALKKNQTYSDYKEGVPYMDFTRKFKEPSTTLPAVDYYAQPHLLYTSEAQIFRLRSGIPDPLEFLELTEEQIFKIQALADTEYLKTFTPRELARYRDALRKATSRPSFTPPPGFESWDTSNKLSLTILQECTFSNRNFKSLPWEHRIYRIRDHISKSWRDGLAPILHEHADYLQKMQAQCLAETGAEIPLPPFLGKNEIKFFEILSNWTDPSTTPTFPVYYSDPEKKYRIKESKYG